ncbi:hypothetical protein [Mesorhizobium denitrificans]|uniref:Neutral/alkaline non-lysosomal ceramidase N-terminal domain-containing protein n=1 Tax=Mesorhizobium denitrificans TaxID=2294114 RepID=A0A371XG55_9HYPH|nr:hypothetical protein [Mesorhizobium denitrificans]RFC68201.1 hypothetical protein DY251_07980 [Mesorhizobium denitrificans]
MIAASSVDLTPDRTLPLVGYAATLRESDGVRSRLESNVILFETNTARVALLGIDALFIGSSFIDAVRGDLIDPTVELLFVATHTHYAPSLDQSKPRLGETDNDWFYKAAKIVAAQINALLGERGIDARASYGSLPCNLSVYRRRRIPTPKSRFPFLQGKILLVPNRSRKNPNELQLFQLQTMEGVPLAVIWSWPCHPVEASNRNSINAAFPGAVKAAIRAATGLEQLPVIFLPGFCGDIRPAITQSVARTAFIEMFKAPSKGDIEAFEKGVCASALKVLASASPVDLAESFQFQRLEMPLSELLEDSTSTLPIASLSCGPFSVTALGAEVCSPYLDQLGFNASKPTFFTGCAAPTFGYLPTDAQIAEGGYEAERFKEFFGVTGSWKPKVTARVVSEMRAVTRAPTSISSRRHKPVEDLLLPGLVEVDG